MLALARRGRCRGGRVQEEATPHKMAVQLPPVRERRFGASGRQSCLCDGPARQPGTTEGKIGIMSNERDCISEYFEAKAVSRGEFEALKRFGEAAKGFIGGSLWRFN
jgi:hypothetical protein